MFYIIGGIVLLIIIIFISTYNSLVKLTNKIEEAFSTMDVYLKKRWDLIPNIVEIVKSYNDYEKGALEEITNLRNKAYKDMNTNDKVDANNQLQSGINKIMAISEAYPDLKASQNFQDLTNQLADIEKDISNSRKYYNGTVRTYNDKVEVFPNNIISGILGFKTKKMFEINNEERENIKIKL